MLEPEDVHHLDSVLRLRVGESVSATDGRGGLVLCRYGGRGVLEPVGAPVFSPPRSPSLTVGFVPVKGDRPDWAVQKLTELGVDRVVVLRSARSVVRWDGARASAHLSRLCRVARSAVMQSRQVWLPAVEGVLTLADAGFGDPGIAIADMGGAPPWTGLHTVLVGPEGGWTEEERSLAGGAVVGLGGSVLRAETAAVTAGALLGALRAGLVAPASAASESSSASESSAASASSSSAPSEDPH